MIATTREGTLTFNRAALAMVVVLMASGPALAQYPANGDFEVWTRSGPTSWSGSGLVQGTTNGTQGYKYLRIVNGFVQSAMFPVNAGQWYAFSFLRKCVSGAGNNLGLRVSYYDASGVFVSSYAEYTSLADNVGTWVAQSSTAWQVPATARFASIAVGTPVSGAEVDVDSIVFDTEERWHYVGTIGTNNVNFDALNHWVNWGAPYAPARFRRDSKGWVTLEGLVKNDVLATTIFVLPPGYRPATAGNIFQTTVSGSEGIIEVASWGEVIARTAPAPWQLSLNLRFKAEQ